MFDLEDYVIIDPSFGSLKNYSVYYDYDLLGQSIKFSTTALENTISVSAYLIEKYKIFFMLSPLICFFGFFIFEIILSLMNRGWNLIKAYRYYQKQIKILKRLMKTRDKIKLPKDFDLYIRTVYCVINQYYGNKDVANKLDLKQQGINDWFETEALRFVMHTAWPHFYGFMNLYQTKELGDGFIEAWNQCHNKNIIKKEE